MTNDDHDRNDTVSIVGPALRDLTPVAFAAFGNGQLAYIKPVYVEGEDAFAVLRPTGSGLPSSPTATSPLRSFVRTISTHSVH